ncbi:MAG TPA: GNAT family N-acetyltransferase [Chitinophagaceae bacterium]|nr:GNAT family N-acetyltransferase [Chitinophagaceae bacterium]
MSELRIDIYSDEYKDIVAKLILDIQQKEFGIPITLDQQPDLGSIPAFYQVDNGNFWIANMGGTIVGTIALLDISNNQGALRKMFVAKEFRGKELGVGQALLSTLLSWARQKGFSEIFLGTTEKFIAAQRFYEKNNFTEIAKQNLPAAFPVMDVDIKFYKITL